MRDANQIFFNAFDTVPPMKLVHNYNTMESRAAGSATSYMTTQSMILDNGRSDTVHNAQSGVPQGSVPGPMLFLF